MLVPDGQGVPSFAGRLARSWVYEPESAAIPAWASLGGSSADANMQNEFVTPEIGIPGLKLTTAAAGAARATFHGPKINLAAQGLLGVRLDALISGGANAFPTSGGINCILSLGNEGPANAGAYASHIGSPRAVIRTWTSSGSTDSDSGVDNQTQDRLNPNTGIKQRNRLVLWLDIAERRAHYGRGLDFIDFSPEAQFDLGVIDPFIRISTRHSQAVDMTLHRFALTAWYA